MIKGINVYIRPIEIEDAESVICAFNEKEGLYMTGTRKMFTLEEIKKAFHTFNKDSTRYDFAICVLGSDEVIGDLSITEIDLVNKKAMYRIALHHKKNYGQGYGTEATQLAQTFFFEELKLNRLELQVFSHNPRGLKAYEKAGFIQEGVLRQTLNWDGVYSDEIIMSILYEDYIKCNDFKNPNT